MMRRSVVKAHRSILYYSVNTDTEEWDVEVAEPETPKVFRFPDDSEQD